MAHSHIGLMLNYYLVAVVRMVTFLSFAL